jgi:hypothetical protein
VGLPQCELNDSASAAFQRAATLLASITCPYEEDSSVELLILIVVLLLLFGGGGFYVYRGGWWGPAKGSRNAGPVGNPLAIISVVVLLIVFVVWRLIILLR